jgi:hypothetical protein
VGYVASLGIGGGSAAPPVAIDAVALGDTLGDRGLWVSADELYPAYHVVNGLGRAARPSAAQGGRRARLLDTRVVQPAYAGDVASVGVRSAVGGERQVSRRVHILCSRLDWDLPICCVFL